MSAEKTDQRCLLCDDDNITTFANQGTLSGVTSDCRPWPRSGLLLRCGACGHVQKKIDQLWRSDINSIYDSYQLYYQGDGAEQVIFTGSEFAPRSLQVFTDFDKTFGINQSGRLLDVGCGRGVALTTFGKIRPGWRLYGFDQSENLKNDVEKINQVEKYYSESIDDIKETFDIITLFHVLEHITEPVTFLARISEKLSPEGVIVIQVPSYARNPFDIPTIDHCSHFTESSLGKALQLAGFQAGYIGAEWLPKEISAVVSKTSTIGTRFGLDNTISEAAGTPEKSLIWLENVAQSAKQASENIKFGIFGTAIAGVWLAGVLGSDIDFFVDEDPSRQGRKFMGRPVVKPGDIPKNSKVYLAFPPGIAGEMLCRLKKSYRDARFVLPPDMMPSK